MLKHFSKFLEQAQTDEKSQGLFDFIQLTQQWPDIVGPWLGQFTRPLKLSQGLFIIVTKHSVFAQELSYMEGTLKQKIEGHFPKLQGEITKIRFQVASQYFN